jgi:hypothetical protein
VQVSVSRFTVLVVCWSVAALAVVKAPAGATTPPVTILYRSCPEGVPRFMERCRLTNSPAVLAAPQSILLALSSRLSIRPNPVRADQDIESCWSAAPGFEADGSVSGALEVHDLAWRRVAVADLQPRGSQLHGRLGSGRTWPSLAGVYSVRPCGAPDPGQRIVVLR